MGGPGATMDGQAIRALREQLNLSQERLAQRLGVSLQSVWRWEQGLARPLPLIAAELERLRREASTQPRPGRDGGARRTSIPPLTRRARGIPRRTAVTRSPGAATRGVGELLKGLGTVLELLSRMADEPGGAAPAGQDPAPSRPGAVAVYGVTIRWGAEGEPLIEPFGNVRATAAGPVIAPVREPLTEVFDESDTVVVVLELPGIAAHDIQLEAERRALAVVAATDGRHYQRVIPLPAPVEPASLSSVYRNGVLEVRLRKR